MNEIVNNPRYRNPLLRAVREQLEHRALWLYLLCDEAGKQGLKWEDFGCNAIKRCGLYQGKNLVEKGKTRSLKGLKKVLFTRIARLVFEMEIVECTDDTLFIDFHYCPLVKAWQKQNCSNTEIERLCDIAMCGDRGIGEIFGAELELPDTIARGKHVCKLRFKRKSQ